VTHPIAFQPSVNPSPETEAEDVLVTATILELEDTVELIDGDADDEDGNADDEDGNAEDDEGNAEDDEGNADDEDGNADDDEGNADEEDGTADEESDGNAEDDDEESDDEEVGNCVGKPTGGAVRGSSAAETDDRISVSLVSSEVW
jgi:hypothetical protein